MGVWGHGVLSDDSARDMYDEYINLFNRGNPPEASRETIPSKFQDLVKDSDEGPVLWLSIAKAQWDCGQLEPMVFSRVREIVSNDLGLDRWRDEGQRTLDKRKAALQKFLSQFQQSNPRPRKPRKAIKRKPVFQPGDCVAVHLDSGNWGALLVLQGPPETNDPHEDTFGKNLVGALRYIDRQPPTLSFLRNASGTIGRRENGWVRWLYVMP